VKIEVEPARVAFDIHADETIIQAAWRNGYTWPTICGGVGTCKTCVFQILSGAENLSPIEPWEASGLRSIADSLPNHGEGSRLACQTRVTADIRLRKIGVRKNHGES
jgi:ferredoxin, 2Fe-2S